MNDVPLVKDNNINSINTSIIAIKKQLRQIVEAVGLIDIPDMPDLSPFVRKDEVVDTVQSGNNNPVTSNAVADNTVPSRIYTDVDLNTLTDFGAYKVSFSDPAQATTTLHYPSANFGTLFVNRSLATNLTQIFFPDIVTNGIPPMFIRYIIIGSYLGDWKAIDEATTSGTNVTATFTMRSYSFDNYETQLKFYPFTANSKIGFVAGYVRGKVSASFPNGGSDSVAVTITSPSCSLMSASVGAVNDGNTGVYIGYQNGLSDIWVHNILSNTNLYLNINALAILS